MKISINSSSRAAPSRNSVVQVNAKAGPAKRSDEQYADVERTVKRSLGAALLMGGVMSVSQAAMADTAVAPSVQDMLREAESLESLMAETDKDSRSIVEQLKKKNMAILELMKDLETDIAKAEEQRKLEELARLEQAAKLEAQARLAEQSRLDELSRLEEQRKIEERRRVEEISRLEAQAKAEEKRREFEISRLEEQRKADEARRQEEFARLEEARKTEEKRRTEELGKLEAQAKAAEAARLETQQRLEEQRKLAEQARADAEAKVEEQKRLAEQARAEAQARLEELQKLAQESESLAGSAMSSEPTKVLGVAAPVAVAGVGGVGFVVATALGVTAYSKDEEMKRQKSALESMDTRRIAAERTIDYLKTELTSQTTSLDAANKALETERQFAQSLSASIRKLKNEMEEKVRDMKSIETEMSRVRNEARSKKDEQDKLTRELEHIRSELELAQRTARGGGDVAEQYKSEVSRLRDEVYRADSELNSVRDAVRVAREEADEAQRELRVARARLEDAERAVGDQSSSYDSLRREVEDKESAARRAEDDAIRAREEAGWLKTEVDRLNAELFEARRREQDAASAARGESDAANRSLQETIRMLKQDLMEKTSLLSNVESDLRSVRSDAQSYQSQAERLAAELQRAKAEAQATLATLSREREGGSSVPLTAPVNGGYFARPQSPQSRPMSPQASRPMSPSNGHSGALAAIEAARRSANEVLEGEYRKWLSAQGSNGNGRSSSPAPSSDSGDLRRLQDELKRLAADAVAGRGGLQTQSRIRQLKETIASRQAEAKGSSVRSGNSISGSGKSGSVDGSGLLSRLQSVESSLKSGLENLDAAYRGGSVSFTDYDKAKKAANSTLELLRRAVSDVAAHERQPVGASSSW